MNINSDTLVSISEANQNFSRVARMVDQYGSAVILKNNTPKYLIIEFAQAQALQTASEDSVETLAARIIEQNRSAYAELAK